MKRAEEPFLFVSPLSPFSCPPFLPLLFPRTLFPFLLVRLPLKLKKGKTCFPPFPPLLVSFPFSFSTAIKTQKRVTPHQPPTSTSPISPKSNHSLSSKQKCSKLQAEKDQQESPLNQKKNQDIVEIKGCEVTHTFFLNSQKKILRTVVKDDLNMRQSSD